ncbi:hypothetical protein EYF80_042242 [Liparis tanakae]|uniref:Uncharacterized protein n=1 Tax=Liparis tanakae TaxID=230148 RepID=A0A4Z2G350_9TELE|nr:hypothetical protein EYF80_042242 [Liparis tanakae]
MVTALHPKVGTTSHSHHVTWNTSRVEEVIRDSEDEVKGVDLLVFSVAVHKYIDASGRGNTFVTVDDQLLLCKDKKHQAASLITSHGSLGGRCSGFWRRSSDHQNTYFRTDPTPILTGVFEEVMRAAAGMYPQTTCRDPAVVRVLNMSAVPEREALTFLFCGDPADETRRTDVRYANLEQQIPARS